MKKWVYLILGAVLAVAAIPICFFVLRRPPEVQPPEIGGQQTPASVREIDFTQRYDVHCSFNDKEPTVFRGCKVVGFTGPDAPTGGGLSGSLSARQYFARWLVLELSDGRLAYIPPASLKYLETAKAP